MKLGFIGYGNMASAIIKGILAAELCAPHEVLVCDSSAEKTQDAQAVGLTICNDVTQLVKNANTIFLCVKPQSFSELLKSIGNNNCDDKTFISIAAGITMDYMTERLGTKTAIVRIMPNTPILLGAGTSAICRNEYVSDESFELVHRVFASSGTVYDIPEDKFDEVINLNGSSPAYIYLFAKTIAEYATEHGIPYETSLAMFSDTLKGAAEMLMHSGDDPDQLIKNVSSPGGTTVAALGAMRENGLVTSLQKGCEACVRRAGELAKES